MAEQTNVLVDFRENEERAGRPAGRVRAFPMASRSLMGRNRQSQGAHEPMPRQDARQDGPLAARRG